MNKSSLYSFIVQNKWLIYCLWAILLLMSSNISNFIIFSSKVLPNTEQLKYQGLSSSLQFLSLVRSPILCFVTWSTSLTFSWIFGKFFLDLENLSPPPTWNQPHQQYFLLSETWVQGDTVMAKIVTADVEAINGRIQFIDTILGIPYLDMTNLICSDLWLL